MPLHPQCRSFLEMLAAAGGPPLEQLRIDEARQAPAAMIPLGGAEEPVAHVDNRTVPGPAGAIPVRVYRPSDGTALPGLVYFHGGGFAICNLDTHDRLCRALANASGAVIVSVDYRLAPEHPYPAAPEDAYAATQYVGTHAQEFGIDWTRLGVGGDSAGGNLATVVTLMARERGGPALKFQLLIYPVVDFEDDSPSMREFGQGHFLDRGAIDWFERMYVPPQRRREPFASPANGDLRGLPPAMIVTGECDPLRDQGEAYAGRLRDAGVSVEQRRYDGMIHPFFNLAGIVDTARTAIADAGAAVRRAL